METGFTAPASAKRAQQQQQRRRDEREPTRPSGSDGTRSEGGSGFPVASGGPRDTATTWRDAARAASHLGAATMRGREASRLQRCRRCTPERNGVAVVRRANRGGVEQSSLVGARQVRDLRAR
ncbi:unnamed protein product [Lampetra fluviatilis]